MQSLVYLQSLELNNCPNIDDWSVLSSFINLESLNVRECGDLTNFDLSNHEKLRSLTLSLGNNLRDGRRIFNADDNEYNIEIINEIKKAVYLESLAIEGDYVEIKDLSFIQALPELRYLELEGVTISPNVYKGIRGHPKLEEVKFACMSYRNPSSDIDSDSDDDMEEDSLKGWKVITKMSDMIHVDEGYYNYLVRK